MATKLTTVYAEQQSAADAYVAKLLQSADLLSPAARELAPHLFAKALPDDLDTLDVAHGAALIERVASQLAMRSPGQPKVHVETFGDGNASARRMALVIINDDMPFLVDSVTQYLSGRGLAIHQLIHPVIKVGRSQSGQLESLGAGNHNESVMYIETDRLSARARQELVTEIEQVLSSVRVAVRDWQAMLAALRDLRASGEDRAFLDWVAADNMTLLGFARRTASGEIEDPLGLFTLPDFALWKGSSPQSPALSVHKADVLSSVHRRVLLDVVMVPQPDGSTALVVGLFTSASYAQQAAEIPFVRQKVDYVIKACGYDPRGHAGKVLAHVLEIFPRDELYQITPQELQGFALRMVSLTERPRPALFLRADADRRFASVFIYVPRDSYSAQVREKLGEWLARTLGGSLARQSVHFLDDVLARVHYIVADPSQIPDSHGLEIELNAMVRGWEDDLGAHLNKIVGGVRAARLALTYGRTFSAAYREQFTAAIAAQDVEHLAALDGKGDRAVFFYRESEDADDRIRLKIYRLGEIIPLAEMVPVLEHFGLKAIEEFAYDLQGGRLGWIHDFVLDAADGEPIDLAHLRDRLEPALTAVLKGVQEDDGFNALILRLGLTAAQTEIFRALFRYMRQTGSSYGLETVRAALLRYPRITVLLNELWESRFNPAAQDEAKASRAVSAIEDELASVSALDDDRILRQYRSVVLATVRTNAYAPARENALAFKLHSKSVPGLPLPVPFMEIWVYSPRVEGIHLRGGKVARGGLRWSDRRDDFRTEVLSLMKAQMVKNAVIVPVGAKGGFYPKQLPNPSDRDAWIKEGTESYKVFIRALLSLTDNLDGDVIVPPVQVVRHDGDDPYLVVAADKGTATFSDIANGIAEDHGFWLGDAFASGGSVGYDHKKMGITAKGAWISVERHFREMNINVATDAVRAIGVGDMSGDVFGNGLLRTKAIQLVAAFDHRHIFIDPAPDAARSFDERLRLFELPRSSWDDYDKSLISAGGGIYPRSAKSIALTPEMKRLLDVSADSLTPTELIQAILKAPVDLLWLGGIGTYIKAASQSHGDAGDKANDATRVDAEDLRVKVVGEGANLGVTQKGRIAFALKGGRINTDFIDNSAGVDCSDNEVNIKILLRQATSTGALALEERDSLLASMTNDVSAIVLKDNYQQTQALSIAESHGEDKLSDQIRLMKALEVQGGLNRAVEGLPSDRELDDRRRSGVGLTRPELAVLLAYAKMTLFEALLKSAVVDDPLLLPDLEAAFPRALQARFAPLMPLHRLKRELIATKLANAMVNRGGLTLAFDLAEETGHSLQDVASSFVAARELFDLRSLWRLIDSYDYKVEADVQTAALTDASRMLRLHMADLLRYSDDATSPSVLVRKLQPGIDRMSRHVFDLLRPEPLRQVEAYREQLQAQGTPGDATRRLAELKAMDGSIGVADLAADLGVADAALAEAYTVLGEQLGLDWAGGACEQLVPADPWERLLLAGTSHETERLRLDLIRRLTPVKADPVAAVQAWLAASEAKVARARTLVAELRSQPPMSTAKITHLTTQVRQLVGG